MKHDKVKIASTPEHYAKYGIKQGVIEKHEDGVHTDGQPGNYEWWYFDGNLDDGSNLVITFQTKPFTAASLPLTPMVSFDFNGTDGENISKMCREDIINYSASGRQCDVVIGKNSFKGDLETYEIHVEIENLIADVRVKRLIPSWRPETGMVVYGTEEQYEYGWLVAVPKGEVWADITLDGVKRSYHGYGYHDHNWGTRNLLELKHHGYWGRAEVDGFTFINAIAYAPEEFDKQDFTMFMLADEKSVIADDSAKVTFSASDEFIDAETGKPIARNISYLYEDGDKKYRISYKIQNTILRINMIEALPPKEKEIAIQKETNPTYLRFTGDVTLEIMDKDVVLETHTGNAIWESMYFGKPEDF